MIIEPHSTPEERAAKRVEDYTGLMWHVAVYVVVNLFLWIIVPQAAFWVTLGWGIGLAFHVAAYFIGDDGNILLIGSIDYGPDHLLVGSSEIGSSLR